MHEIPEHPQTCALTLRACMEKFTASLHALILLCIGSKSKSRHDQTTCIKSLQAIQHVFLAKSL